MIHGKKSVALVKRSDCIPHYANREIECGVASQLRMATLRSRHPDNLNGAALGETPGPRFFLFLLAVVKCGSAGVFAALESPSSEELGRGDQAARERNMVGETPGVPCAPGTVQNTCYQT